MVGGYPPGTHVEVHDVRFVIGRALRDCFPALKAGWWGGEDRFHVDAWGALEWADGYDVVVADEPPAGAAADKALWFVNLGGYDPAYFGELHRNVFVVAGDRAEAKKKGLALAKDWVSPHRDVAVDVDDAINVGETIEGAQRVFLVPNAEEKPFRFEARYLAKLD